MSSYIKGSLLFVFGLITIALVVFVVLLYLTPNIFSSFIPPTETRPSAIPIVLASTVTPATPRTLPPTWTPTASLLPSPTQAKSTITPSPEPFKFTVQAPSVPFSVNGNGSMNSWSFMLPAGRTTLTWKYSGAPGEGSQVQYAYNVYQNDLDYYKRVYQIWYDYYKQLEMNASDSRDAMAMLDAQRGLNKITDEYNQNVQAAKSKYDQAISGYNSSFVLSVFNTKTNKNTILVSTKGNYNGNAAFTAEDKVVYYFSIQSSGAWQIQVTPKK